MPPSQLKKLKISLRENGVIKQRESKKKQRQAAKDGTLKESRIQKNTALQSIREVFNPFEAKPASRDKHDDPSNWTSRERRSVVARPGITKGLGEVARRKTLLIEMQKRRKVGGISDHRFGESDSTMTPEEKALRRFAAEKQRAFKRSAIFDLENEEGYQNLTHFGQSISSDPSSRTEDFEEPDLEPLEGHMVNPEDHEESRKRRRLSKSDMPEDRISDLEINGTPERHKTKNEMMKEVISKSKVYKFERQQAKEDDDNLRAEIDKDLPNIYELIRGNSNTISRSDILLPAQHNFGSMNVDRNALLNSKEQSQAGQAYDQRLRQMALDQRAKPTVATLSNEEKAAHEAQRLKDLEQRRVQRMRGEPVNSDSEESEFAKSRKPGRLNEKMAAFDLGSGLGGEIAHRELGVEDEDDFVIDENIVDIELGDEDLNPGESDSSSYESNKDEDNDYNDNDAVDKAEYVHDFLSKEYAGSEGISVFKANTALSAKKSEGNIAFTFPCPQTHEEFLDVIRSVTVADLPIVVQRIRALYQPQLALDNKEKLGKFATVLVNHIPHMANASDYPPFVVFEALIRHVHSLAKTFPDEVGSTFRNHIKSISDSRPKKPTAGDLIIFTAISSIFPTSDHFHQVVTPALLCMTQYLAQNIPLTLTDLTIGTYIVSLCVKFQNLSKRYIPEVIYYSLNTIVALLPQKPKQCFQVFPQHMLSKELQLKAMADEEYIDELRLDFWSNVSRTRLRSPREEQSLKLLLLRTHLRLIETMASLWADKSASCEVFDLVYATLQFVADEGFFAINAENFRTLVQNTAENILEFLEKASNARQPLRLHSHRPLAIKTSMPKFEESYDPNKHYDPDRDRSELSRLKAEHKKERKGALRELRKDANFLARENLAEKKERDRAYEKKFKRLVAEIQGEEGREAKLYEKEKKMRKGKK